MKPLKTQNNLFSKWLDAAFTVDMLILQSERQKLLNDRGKPEDWQNLFFIIGKKVSLYFGVYNKLPRNPKNKVEVQPAIQK